MSDRHDYLIAITGGIGSGKSVVSRVLLTMGYPVYDCDSRAKAIMDESEVIKRRISAEISSEAISNDSIDRARLAEIVFADAKLLDRLNEIVHSAVRDDLQYWCAKHPRAFVETAILYQSGLDRMVDEVWNVTAPRQLRIARVMDRNQLSREAVEARINTQDAYHVAEEHRCVRNIVNDGDIPVLPQVLNLISQL